MAIIEYMTQADFLAVADRVLPENYLAPLKASPNGGYEILQAAAKVFERVSIAIARFDAAAFILSAEGSARARLTCSFSRPSAAAGAVTIKAGTLVKASSRGALFRLTTDVVFGALDVGEKNATVEAIGPGHEYNVDGEFTSGLGEIQAGEIDVIDLPLLDPPFGDQSFQVTNHNGVSAAYRGREAALDLHGAERDVRRLAAEGDASYAERIRSTPKAVTPTNLRQRIARFFSAMGLTADDWYLVECGDVRFQTVYDAPEGVTYTYQPNYDETLFLYDDPRDASPVRNRWQDERSLEGAFVLEVPEFACVADVGACYDDPADDLPELLGDLGVRAVPCYDLPSELPEGHLECCYDGGDAGVDRIYADLFALLDRGKAWGVFVEIHVRGD